MTVKLINLRGRVVEVPELQVPDLLKRGFVYIPRDQPDMTYSQVHDRGENVQEAPRPKEAPTQRVVAKLGDILDRVESL